MKWEERSRTEKEGTNKRGTSSIKERQAASMMDIGEERLRRIVDERSIKRNKRSKWVEGTIGEKRTIEWHFSKGINKNIHLSDIHCGREDNATQITIEEWRSEKEMMEQEGRRVIKGRLKKKMEQEERRIYWRRIDNKKMTCKKEKRKNEIKSVLKMKIDKKNQKDFVEKAKWKKLILEDETSKKEIRNLIRN